jgi:hypothetical protein
MMNNPDKLKEMMTEGKIDEALDGMKQNIQNMSAGQVSGGQPAEVTEGDSAKVPVMPFPGMPGMGMSGMGMPGMMGMHGMGMPGMGMPAGLQSMMGGVSPEDLNNLMAGFNLEKKPTEAKDNSISVDKDDDPKQNYKSQLEHMSLMGFTDEAANVELLKETNGDAEKAIEKALEKMG